MTTWHDTQTTLRAAAVAHGLAPWASPDHAADLVRTLASLHTSALVAVQVRASNGQPWAVTRYAGDDYRVAHADGRVTRGSAEAVVAFMEGRG